MLHLSLSFFIFASLFLKFVTLLTVHSFFIFTLRSLSQTISPFTSVQLTRERFAFLFTIFNLRLQIHLSSHQFSYLKRKTLFFFPFLLLSQLTSPSPLLSSLPQPPLAYFTSNPRDKLSYPRIRVFVQIYTPLFYV